MPWGKVNPVFEVGLPLEIFPFLKFKDKNGKQKLESRTAKAVPNKHPQQNG